MTPMFAISRKTGKKHRVDPKRSRAAKKAGMKRRGKHESSSTRRAIMMGVKKAIRTGRTSTGRRSKR